MILGGQDDDDNVLDSALKFDPEKNQCHEIASLPHPLKGLATVRSKDQIIVFGGLGKDNEVHNDVFMYDCMQDRQDDNFAIHEFFIVVLCTQV